MEGHQLGIHLWVPPPSAAKIAFKQLAYSQLKQPYDVSHVFIIPWIMYQEEWNSRFKK